MHFPALKILFEPKSMMCQYMNLQQPLITLFSSLQARGHNIHCLGVKFGVRFPCFTSLILLLRSCVTWFGHLTFLCLHCLIRTLSKRHLTHRVVWSVRWLMWSLLSGEIHQQISILCRGTVFLRKHYNEGSVLSFISSSTLAEYVSSFTLLSLLIISWDSLKKLNRVCFSDNKRYFCNTF